jgi:SPP1 family phage portal protein
MFTKITWQDWQNEPDKAKATLAVIGAYKHSEDFDKAGIAQRYYEAQNDTVSAKVVLRATTSESEQKTADGKTVKKKGTATEAVPGQRIYSDFFRRFTMQQANYLLGNGVELEDDAMKGKLGIGFDTTLAKIGLYSLVHGVCWGYWNVDHVEILRAYTDKNSGFVALLDELTGEPMVGVQFWQIGDDKPLMARVFEPDGVTVYKMRENASDLEVAQEKRAYKRTYARDITGERLVSEENYSALPIVPLYANDKKQTELTLAIRSKIDLYDIVLSDFGNNLEKANDVYWVLNNFGGNFDEVALMLEQIHRLKAIANISDGTSSSTVTPETFEVPYAARQTALELLERQLYRDYMALDVSELTGGSLTNVAIRASMANLDLKANAYEWQCFDFVQKLLRILGIETETIRFKRQTIANESEIIQNIYTAQGDLDKETRLKLNPMILPEEIDDIIKRGEEESLLGIRIAQQAMQQTEGDEQNASDSDGNSGSVGS